MRPAPNDAGDAGTHQARAQLRVVGRSPVLDRAEDVLRLVDSGRLRRATGLVGRAASRPPGPGADPVIDLVAPLREVLPGRGLRRGSTVVARGAASPVLALLAGPSRAGAWCAVVGMPDLGPAAAAELGVDLARERPAEWWVLGVTGAAA